MTRNSGQDRSLVVAVSDEPACLLDQLLYIAMCALMHGEEGEKGQGKQGCEEGEGEEMGWVWVGRSEEGEIKEGG